METPCIRICVIEPLSQLCTGCGRTLEEIGGWSSYDDDERRRIMQSLPMRLEQMNHREAEPQATEASPA